VGFKPSLGRIDSLGLVYFSRTMDQVGLFTHDVAGMAVAAAVVCRDWQPPEMPAGKPILGVPAGPYLEQAEPEALAAFGQQIERLRGAGFSVREVPAFPDVADLNRLHRRLVFGEFAREHAALYAQYAPLYRPRTVEIIEIGRAVGDDELAQARAHSLELRHDLAARMQHAGIDLWVCPAANGPAPLGLDSTGDPAMALPWTHAGMPAITLPAGRAANGLPLGLQLVASFGADERLLAWAQVVQAA
jgi:Asp-tRNA(Asn)/Glu-tRNA(Gln) amidotransferase A subunit family amidase